MSPTTSARLRGIMGKVPFPQMTLLVIALFFIREQFPFSNFPMYSNISEEADVAFVTDQKNDPLPMKALFRTSSGTSKKMFRKELGTLTEADGRDSEAATTTERARAGKAVLDTLVARLRPADVPPGTTALRFYVRTFRAGGGKIADLPPELLAEKPLPTP